MTQDEALEILKAGCSVLLTGEPGSGKTHTAMRYVRWLRDRGVEVAVTASTGIAATHLGGFTVHSWSGIGVKQELTGDDLDRIKRRQRVARQVRGARVLVIDEISMLSGVTLGLVDRVCRKLRERPEPFGGLQVVLVGDFFQLPPVPPRPDEPRGTPSLFAAEEEAEDLFAFRSSCFAELDPVVCYLTEQHRQEDAAFLGLLVAMRRGELSGAHLATLEARRRPGVQSGPGAEGVTQLFSHNVDVDRINDAALGRLPGEPHEYLMALEGPPELTGPLARGCPSPERLVLREGARVMLTRNSFTEGYVNGTTGQVVGFTGEPERLPVVRHSGAQETVAAPAEWTIKARGEVLARIVQVPLRLAWAITVHKSQGMSLDAAHVDLTRAFAYGQGYVALSRLRTLGGLTLAGFNRRALAVDPGIRAHDAELRRLSASARAELLDDLAALGERQRRFLEQCGASAGTVVGDGGAGRDRRPTVAPVGKAARKTAGSSGSAEAARVGAPSSHRPWTADEERELAARASRGESIRAVARALGRRPGAIRSRLKKLGLRAGGASETASTSERASRLAKGGAAQKTSTVDAARERHPQAYHPWTADEDSDLSRRFSQGEDADDIARALGRQPSAVWSRVQKLGLSRRG